jgi:hypothetical protein
MAELETRKYKVWAATKSGAALVGDDFKEFVAKKIVEVHKHDGNFDCELLDSETLGDLGTNPPPSHFVFFFLAKRRPTTSPDVNFNSKSLLDYHLRTDEVVNVLGVNRIYFWS